MLLLESSALRISKRTKRNQEFFLRTVKESQKELGPGICCAYNFVTYDVKLLELLQHGVENTVLGLPRRWQIEV